MWMFITLYLLIGGAVAKAEMEEEEEDKIKEAKRYYPTWMVLLAVVIAFIAVAIIWPYVVYKIWEK